MKNGKNIKIVENYSKLYEDLKKKYQYKEKENQQLKALLKQRDKEIISLKKKLKYDDENINSINKNKNCDEISQRYIQDLIKDEIENIKREQIYYRNKILTIENYELQYLAPKLMTASNHNFNFSSYKLNDKVKKEYFCMKNEMKENYKVNSDKKRKINKNNIYLDLDYKYKTIDKSYNEDKHLLNESYNKIMKPTKRLIYK